jgi:hypothetical protein
MLGYGPPDAVDKQLEVIAASDMYLRSGAFKADEVIGAWKAAMADAMYDGRWWRKLASAALEALTTITAEAPVPIEYNGVVATIAEATSREFDGALRR